MPQTEDNPTPPFPAYRVTVDGVGLYITGHYPDLAQSATPVLRALLRVLVVPNPS